jgi:hypothetical protein
MARDGVFRVVADRRNSAIHQRMREATANSLFVQEETGLTLISTNSANKNRLPFGRLVERSEAIVLYKIAGRPSQ